MTQALITLLPVALVVAEQVAEMARLQELLLPLIQVAAVVAVITDPLSQAMVALAL
jgi:hypothetical protein